MFPPTSRILVVDDILSMQEMTINALRNMGFSDIAVANNGKQALDRIKNAEKQNLPIEIIISDWNMPEMNGIDLLDLVRQSPTGRTTPFLLLTTESEKSKVVEAITLGVSNYMVKPITEGVLHSKLKEIWARSQKKDTPKTA